MIDNHPTQIQLDKSKIVLFGGLILLVLVLMDGGLHFHGFGMHHGGSLLKWVLFGLLFWLIFSRCGCCGSADTDESEEVEEKAPETSDSI